MIENVHSSDSVRLISVYRKRAKRYDRSALLLYFAGFRHWAYRKKAIQSLALNPGDTVVDLGCGTGLNFILLQEQIGPRGRIIGVDLTDAMLDAAAARIARHTWSNVELVKSDAAAFVFPSAVDGILSTFALTLVPDFDQVIRNGASSLQPGKRFVILDFKNPSGWLMNKAAPLLALLLTGPFGGTLAMASRKPWQSLERHLALIKFTNLYLGGAYIAASEKSFSPPVEAEPMRHAYSSESTSHRGSTWMLNACGVWLVGLGLYFIFLRPPLLPEDLRFMGTTLEQIRTAVPDLESWLSKVFTVTGGFMAGAGVFTVFVATAAMPSRLKGASWAIALTGVLTVVLMSATNFALHSDSRWLLLLPALVWLAGLLLHVAGPREMTANPSPERLIQIN